MAMEVYFVTGTGTDVGKTYCASRYVEMRRAKGQRVGVYKPVASGCQQSDEGQLVAADAVELWRAAGCPHALHDVCPQRFAASLAPPLAASAEGRQVDETLLMTGLQVWANSRKDSILRDAPNDVLVIEGAGGLFSPISESLLNTDFALRLRDQFPQVVVILVARNRLGVIHECVAAVRAAQASGLNIDKIVLNEFGIDKVNCDESMATNAEQIRRWTGCSVEETW